MSTGKTRAAVIVGAGFSKAAGLPLTGALLNTQFYLSSNGARARAEDILSIWEKWKEANPSAGVEQFIGAVYERRVPGAFWQTLVEVIQAVLATPRGPDWPTRRSPRYEGRITVPIRCRAHEVFWEAVLRRFDLQAVATTNYDLFVERGLRHRAIRSMPGVHYGGVKRPQILVGTAQPFSVHKQDRIVEMEGAIPLFKLHGSLNWSFKNVGPTELQMYQDPRASFRKGGDAAIVPPLPEKIAPSWLKEIWIQCEQALKTCQEWIVVGYSLPVYDVALSQMFQRAGVAVKKVWLLDPYGRGAIESRWQTAAPGATIVCLAGLPEALLMDPFV